VKNKTYYFFNNNRSDLRTTLKLLFFTY